MNPVLIGKPRTFYLFWLRMELALGVEEVDLFTVWLVLILFMFS